ncbi:MAG: multiple sugar transport system permease protein, partial [Candidatus Hydrogenedentes bacterium]|nr:multiple sugar transport system permease protein [Candidatus Hydrogenedentota bacterium]
MTERASRSFGYRPGARTASAAFVYTLVAAGAVTMIAPYLFLTINSLKSVEDFTKNPYSLWPNPLDFSAYVRAFTLGRVGIYLWNSLLYAVIGTAVQLFLDSLAAFGFARLKFPGQNFLFALLLSTMMLPAAVTLIPVYLLIVQLGIADTRMGVMLPGFAGAFG